MPNTLQQSVGVYAMNNDGLSIMAWKLFAPLLIVRAMVAASTKLESSLWKVRLTLPVTVLLTLVCLQQRSNAVLPNLPQLSFIDAVFVVAYLLAPGHFGLMLWGCRRYFTAMQIESAAEREDALHRPALSDDGRPSALILVGMGAAAVPTITKSRKTNKL
ncbi:MAG: hypothetical protein ACKOZT_02230 [Cyanobium sp.]